MAIYYYKPVQQETNCLFLFGVVSPVDSEGSNVLCCWVTTSLWSSTVIHSVTSSVVAWKCMNKNELEI
jgi:hypothetical protein